MARRLLFSNVDIHSVFEHQKRELRAAYEKVSNDLHDDPKTLENLVESFSINVPVLREEAKEASQRQVKQDVSREPDRFITDRSRPFFVDATEITLHIPFEGDAAVFDVQPSTFSLSPPLGDIEGHELLLSVTISREGMDAAALLNQALSGVKKYLEWLRPAEVQNRRFLQLELQSLMGARKQLIKRHEGVISSLGIPIRAPRPEPTPQSPTISERKAARASKKPNSWHVFISHAREDKESIARPLAEAFRRRGLDVWYDEYTLKVGDSLRKTIDVGLSKSEFGVVILSESFFGKHWPEQELNGLADRESKGKKVILPVWHGVTHDEVSAFSPTLADRLAVSTDKGVEFVVDELLDAMK